MTKPLFTERLSVGVTPEMDRYLEDLARVRTRKGKPVSKADLIREAVRYYMDNQDDLTGSRRQIARSLDGKLQVLTNALESLQAQVNTFSTEQQATRTAIDLYGQTLTKWSDHLKKFVEWIEQRDRTRKI